MEGVAAVKWHAVGILHALGERLWGKDAMSVGDVRGPQEAAESTTDESFGAVSGTDESSACEGDAGRGEEDGERGGGDADGVDFCEAGAAGDGGSVHVEAGSCREESRKRLREGGRSEDEAEAKKRTATTAGQGSVHAVESRSRSCDPTVV